MNARLTTHRHNLLVENRNLFRRFLRVICIERDGQVQVIVQKSCLVQSNKPEKLRLV